MITIVEPRGIIESELDGGEAIMRLLERAGRTCYKSEDQMDGESAERFIQGIIRRGHESVIEHAVISARIICDRSTSHQLVRHRLAAYSQESQRYCDYGKKGCQVICPPSIGIAPGSYEIDDFHLVFDGNGNLLQLNPVHSAWLTTVGNCYESYLTLREANIRPEDARSVLPNATKTEVFSTFNLRIWRHIFKERGLNRHAQWQIRGIFRELLDQFVVELPAVFGDLLEV
jgi:thymidylate synthase (FAD)